MQATPPPGSLSSLPLRVEAVACFKIIISLGYQAGMEMVRATQRMRHRCPNVFPMPARMQLHLHVRSMRIGACEGGGGSSFAR